MATKRRPKNNESHEEDGVSPKSSMKLRTSRRLESIRPVSTGMSLDVLAQVASETLENEPASPKKIRPKRLSMRTIQSLEVLTLEQILGLKEKILVSMFSDVESNEMRRNFTYTCYLMPKQCQKQYTSFGSEMKALADIKKHLKKHLDDLTKEANSPGRKTKFKFTAEPLQIRKKRIYDLLIPAAKKRKSKQAESNGKQASNSNTILVPKLGSNTQIENDPMSVAVSDFSENADGPMVKTIVHRSNKKVSGKQLPVLHNVKVETPTEIDEEADEGGNEETERRIEENEQFIIDLLSKTQPHHDHNYTTIFGRRKGSDIIHHLMEDSDEEQDLADNGNTIVYLDKKGKKTKKRPNAKPILFLRHRSPNENVPMVSKEEVINDQNVDSDSEEDELVRMTIMYPYANSNTAEKPYPPMPKARSDNIGHLKSVFQEPEPDDTVVKEKKKINRNPPFRREGNLGWEPKLAMKFIKELKGKKKNENIPLVCKICRDKTFTATATLMYHYRSHAGIKPFVCLICKTTFTRQHSLNYHMLIHNNQSRFTCKDCGKKFRHPSHFKEHLRRHTGETPFECSDCGQKFKTRNTYKRHLKTRHGKLLTASGITQMSKEEFMKVRTKRHKTPRLPDISYTMPELTFIKRSALARREKGHRDSEELVNVDEILKTVDEIKREIESGSDTEAAENTSQDKSVTGATEQTKTVTKGKATKAAKSTFNVLESVYKSSTLSVLESVCSEVLTGNSGKSGGPQMEFREIRPKPTVHVHRRPRSTHSKRKYTDDISGIIGIDLESLISTVEASAKNNQSSVVSTSSAKTNGISVTINAAEDYDNVAESEQNSEVSKLAVNNAANTSNIPISAAESVNSLDSESVTNVGSGNTEVTDDNIGSNTTSQGGLLASVGPALGSADNMDSAVDSLPHSTSTTPGDDDANVNSGDVDYEKTTLDNINCTAVPMKVQ